MDAKEFIIERLILKVGNTINNRRIEDLKESDLTPAQSETILFYDRIQGANIRDLASYLKVSHQAARKLVEKLKSKGILESSVSSDDRRYTNIYLTEDGAKLCGKLKKSGTSTGMNILDGFSSEEKEQLLGFMERIEKNTGR